VIRALTFDLGDQPPIRSRLIVRSDSFYGNGLFFDPWPWLTIGLVVLAVSILFWLPFVRHITGSVRQMTTAADRLAHEDFSVRVDDDRADELGILGSSINELASRLEGFVTGQKRFLGSISHELNSPLARMQFALSILEESSPPEELDHIRDVKEEVEIMSKLVSELLSYSKTGIQGAAVKLQPVVLKPVVERAAQREGSDTEVGVFIDDDLSVIAQPELLYRALANVVRNAATYSQPNGVISIDSDEIAGKVTIRISDQGPGVPADALEKIFDPLFRVQDDRSRSTGGTGLGLAIAKTCIETCDGRIWAENVSPHGLQVSIQLRAS